MPSFSDTHPGPEEQRVSPGGGHRDAALLQRLRARYSLPAENRQARPVVEVAARPEAPAGAEARRSVFISYSHKDEAWKDRLVTQLRVLEMQGLLEVWDDRRIAAGAEWEREIATAINRAAVAILMISADFLTSRFILGQEAPRLLARRQTDGLHVFPLIVKPCPWQLVPWLAPLQARPKDGRPLLAGSDYQIEADLAAIAVEVHALLETTRTLPASPPEPLP